MTDCDGEQRGSKEGQEGHEKGGIYLKSKECSGLDSVESDDSDAEYRMSPVELKNRGNASFKKGDYFVALETWRLGLKQTLKASMNGILSKDNHDLCSIFRLNMAQALIKTKDWSEALDQLEVVLSAEPENVKALFRKAQAYYDLQVNHCDLWRFVCMATL